MDTKQAYNIWANQYDNNDNKTRDLEVKSLRTSLETIVVDNCLEIGCGTGKNSQFLLTKAKHLTAVDFSDQMLAKAKQKITATNIEFIQADITEEWNFISKSYDLVTFSLVLEHIENLGEIFRKLSMVCKPNALIYVGELHPFKQYTGSKARFDLEGSRQILNCYNHHLSDFSNAAKENGFDIISVSEYFDNDDRAAIPRILSLLFQKK